MDPETSPPTPRSTPISDTVRIIADDMRQMRAAVFFAGSVATFALFAAVVSAAFYGRMEADLLTAQNAAKESWAREQELLRAIENATQRITQLEGGRCADQRKSEGMYPGYVVYLFWIGGACLGFLMALARAEPREPNRRSAARG